MRGDPPVPPPSGSQLDVLMSVVRAARDDVDVLRAGRVDPALLVAARGALLDALENYAAELVRRRLPMPPALRDDLRLQRGIRGARRLR
jgi:hypothetical protein